MNEEFDFDKHEFPPAILSMINENSNGGYFLVTLDENGNPVVSFSFDNPSTKNFILSRAKTAITVMKLDDDDSWESSVRETLGMDDDKFYGEGETFSQEDSEE